MALAGVDKRVVFVAQHQSKHIRCVRAEVLDSPREMHCFLDPESLSKLGLISSLNGAIRPIHFGRFDLLQDLQALGLRILVLKSFRAPSILRIFEALLSLSLLVKCEHFLPPFYVARL